MILRPYNIISTVHLNTVRHFFINYSVFKRIVMEFVYQSHRFQHQLEAYISCACLTLNLLDILKYYYYLIIFIYLATFIFVLFLRYYTSEPLILQMNDEKHVFLQ